jgi:hypothetical protein
MSSGNWLLLFHVSFHEPTYADVTNYLCHPGWLKDASSVKKMMFNRWRWGAVQCQKSRHLARAPGSSSLWSCSLHSLPNGELNVWHTNGQGSSLHRQLWPSPSSLGNFLSYVCVRCVTLSDITRDTWKKKGFMHRPFSVWEYVIDRILQWGICLLYSFTTTCALPSQNPYTKYMLQYSLWESTGDMLQHFTVRCSSCWVWTQ